MLVSQDSQTSVCSDLIDKTYTITLSLVTGVTDDQQLDREALKQLESMIEYLEENGITDGTTEIAHGVDISFSSMRIIL